MINVMAATLVGQCQQLCSPRFLRAMGQASFNHGGGYWYCSFDLDSSLWMKISRPRTIWVWALGTGCWAEGYAYGMAMAWV